jgi:PAP2 superfamily protein
MRLDGRAWGAVLVVAVGAWRWIGAWWGRALASPEAGALWEWLQRARPVARRLWAWALRARAAAASTSNGARELGLMVGAYGAYVLIRGIWGGSLAVGRENAAQIISVERSLGIDIEPALQRFFLEHGLAMPFWNVLYVASQVLVLPLTLILVYRFARTAYSFARNLVLLSWTGGVIWYAVQPVAPPRLTGLGYVDTVSTQTVVHLDSWFVQLFYNPIAAMPSLHVGMAPVVGWALWRLTRSAWTRGIGLAYPLLVTVAVVVTGNHFILDVAGGLVVVLPAAAISCLICSSRYLGAASAREMAISTQTRG